MSNEMKQWVLASHPTGMPTTENWQLQTAPMPEPGAGEVMTRAVYLSVDPYMRGRISPRANYAAGVGLGDVMHGGGVGVVVESNDPALKPGDIVESFRFDWQEYNVQKGSALRKVDPEMGPIHSALSYLGLPGLTAYFTMLAAGELKAGDDAVISAASGAVGQVAGQIAVIKGARPIAVAGSDEKVAWCKELGYADGINYKTAPDLTAAVKKACPDGVDLFLDNTAGPIHDAVMRNLAEKSRTVICGTVALADTFEEPDIGERFLRNIMIARATIRGFILFDHADHFDQARAELSSWAKSGKLRHKEDMMQGIESMPAAFLRLMTGANMGKQLIQVSDDPTV